MVDQTRSADFTWGKISSTIRDCDRNDVGFAFRGEFLLTAPLSAWSLDQSTVFASYFKLLPSRSCPPTL
jgi:hypothetical protein